MRRQSDDSVGLFYLEGKKVIPHNIYELLTPVALAHLIPSFFLKKKRRNLIFIFFLIKKNKNLLRVEEKKENFFKKEGI